MIPITGQQKVRLTINPRTAVGDPATIDGVPTYTSSDTSVVTISPDPNDDKACYAVAVGGEGTATVTVECDADLGSGIRTITGTEDIEVSNDSTEASSVSIEHDTPQAK